MGLWSKIKKAAKKVWQKVKAVVRIIIRIVLSVIAFGISLFTGLIEIFYRPEKHMTIHVMILSMADPTNPGRSIPVCTEAETDTAILGARRIWKDRANIKLHSYTKGFTQVLEEVAPDAALNVRIAGTGFLDFFSNLKDIEFADAGEFFAQHAAGWNVIPISLRFPVTIFIVDTIVDGNSSPIGFSFGPLTDYVLVARNGGIINRDGTIDNDQTIAHELCHACNRLGHSGKVGHLVFGSRTDGTTKRGETMSRWDKFWIRGSRHVTYF